MNHGNQIFGKKWRVAIIHALRSGALRFSQIKTLLPGCSVKVLSEALQDMESHGVIKRRQYATIPVKVTYELTDNIKIFTHVIDKYRVMMLVHLYVNKKNYDLPNDLIDELKIIISKEDLDVTNLLIGK